MNEMLVLMNTHRLTGICGIVAPLIALLFISLAINSFDSFSFLENWLSDLGTNKNSALFFNTGLVIAGFLGLMFSAAFSRKNGAGYIMIIGTFSLAATGIFPASRGIIHDIFASMFFIFMALSELYMGMTEKGYKKILFLFLTTISIVAWMPLIFSGAAAVSESIAIASVSIFMMFLGYEIMTC